MTTIKTISLLLAIILINACSNGVKVNTDYDKSSDFHQLKTFMWMKHDGENKANGLMHNRIESSIEKQLTVQGFKLVEQNADFLINYGVTTKDNVEIHNFNTYGASYAPNWGWRGGYGYRGMAYNPGYSQTVVNEYKTGTLIIDVLEHKKNQLIWRGIGSKKLPEKHETEELDELVDLVVESILINFPPKSQ